MMFFLSSCNNNKKVQMFPSLLSAVHDFQKKLPLTIDDGYILKNVEYVDTLFTIQYEIDESICDFNDFVKGKKESKELFLLSISSFEEDERKSFEYCANYNVYMCYFLKGKSSNKEMRILISPNEIKKALRIRHSALDILRKQIEGEKKALPVIIDEDIAFTDMYSYDSMVYVKIIYNGNKYHFTKDVLDDLKKDIQTSMWKEPFFANFLKKVAQVHFALAFCYVDSLSGKIDNIKFTPNEIEKDFLKYK